jgi:hypothetical protein
MSPVRSRLALAAVATVSLLLGAAPSATAEPPQDASGTAVLTPAFTYCTYDIQAVLTGKGNVIAKDDFTVITSPGLKITLSANGRSAHLTATGSFKVTSLADGNTLTEYRGNNLVSDPAVGFLALSGHFAYVSGPNGEIVENLDGTGKRTDLCALLS